MKLNIDCKAIAHVFRTAQFVMLVILFILGIGNSIGTTITPMDPVDMSWNMMFLDMTVLYLLFGRIKDALENMADSEGSEDD